MSVDTERSSTESSAASGLGYEDTALALTLRLPGSDPGRSSPLAAPSDAAPSPKTRVVGWPPVRSYRKNALADSSKANRSASFVKVAVDGAAYLRKVDLQAYGGYDQLLRALQDKFFSHFTISQCFVHRPALGLVFRSALLCLIERYVPAGCARREVRRRREEAGGRGERDGVRAHVRGQGWRLDARRRRPLEVSSFALSLLLSLI
uniref:Auxin-responsive protein n=1 Tax=Zea mays TaxID=4577 RepID=C0P7B5_MAIZE|nr:unknown [Zea mays]